MNFCLITLITLILSFVACQQIMNQWPWFIVFTEFNFPNSKNLKKHVWFLFRSLQLDWYKCCFERKENVEGTNAFCLMIGYEFFLDTVVTLTFFQCFIFLAAFSSWPRSFIICQKKSEMWVSTGLFEIQQVKSTKKWNNITLIHM